MRWFRRRHVIKSQRYPEHAKNANKSILRRRLVHYDCLHAFKFVKVQNSETKDFPQGRLRSVASTHQCFYAKPF